MSPLRRGICTGQGHKTGFSEARGNRIGNSGAVDAEAALFHHLSKRRPTILALARAILGRSGDIPTVCDMMARQGHRADSRGFGQLAGETAMEGDSSDSRASQMLKHAVGMVAAAGAYKGLQLTWKQVTGKEPPPGPDDQQAPLGRAITWTLVMGAAITTARMIAIRYTSKMLHGEQQAMKETAAQPLADNPAAGA